jgi:hypothetical protein
MTKPRTCRKHDWFTPARTKLELQFKEDKVIAEAEDAKLLLPALLPKSTEPLEEKPLPLALFPTSPDPLMAFPIPMHPSSFDVRQ